MKVMKQKQAGMTLTESLLVLAVGALIAVLAYGAYRMATTDVKSQSQVNGIVQLSGKVKQVFASAANFTGVNNQAAIESRIIPADLKAITVAPWTISNAWGGGVVLAGAAANFTVTIDAIPSEGCSEFLAGIASAGTTLTMGGTSVKAAGAAFNPVTAGTQCAASTGAGATSTAVLTVQ